MRKNKIFFLLIIFIFDIAAAQSDFSEHHFFQLTKDQNFTEDTNEPGETIAVTRTELFRTPTRSERVLPDYKQRSLDPKFKDNYKGERFNYEETPVEQAETSDPLFNVSPFVLKIISYVALGLIVLTIIYYILKNSGGFYFGKNRKKINYHASAEQVLEDSENIDNNNFERLIQKAKSENNYRLAVRYYFLWVLQSLSDKGLINWNKDKTNYDYFVELGSFPIKDDFFSNSHIYNYIWYGNFEMNQNEFLIAESIFQKTLKKLK